MLNTFGFGLLTGSLTPVRSKEASSPHLKNMKEQYIEQKAKGNFHRKIMANSILGAINRYVPRLEQQSVQ